MEKSGKQNESLWFSDVGKWQDDWWAFFLCFDWRSAQVLSLPEAPNENLGLTSQFTKGLKEFADMMAIKIALLTDIKEGTAKGEFMGVARRAQSWSEHCAVRRYRSQFKNLRISACKMSKHRFGVAAKRAEALGQKNGGPYPHVFVMNGPYSYIPRILAMNTLTGDLDVSYQMRCPQVETHSDSSSLW